MDTSAVGTLVISRKRKRNEEEKAKLEEKIKVIVVSVIAMLMGVIAWYYEKYFVKEPARDWELDRRSFLNRLYRGIEKDCIEQLRVSKQAFFKLCRILEEKRGLVRTRNVPTTEVVVMFLHILAFKSHEEAKRFWFKVILNWDDIVDLCAKDRATGIGAETALDADDVMSKEANEEHEVDSINIDLEEPSSATKKRRQSAASTSTQSRRKSGEKDGIVASMREVVESLKEFVQATTKKTEEKDVKEVMNELEKIPNLDNAHWLKAINWLTENPSQLVVVKALPLEKKKDYILDFMS